MVDSSVPQGPILCPVLLSRLIWCWHPVSGWFRQPRFSLTTLIETFYQKISFEIPLLFSVSGICGVRSTISVKSVPVSICKITYLRHTYGPELFPHLCVVYLEGVRDFRLVTSVISRTKEIKDSKYLVTENNSLQVVELFYLLSFYYLFSHFTSTKKFL